MRRRKGEFRSVNLPKYLVDEIEERVKNDPTFRYASIARFVAQAIIEKLEKEDERKIVREGTG